MKNIRLLSLIILIGIILSSCQSMTQPESLTEEPSQTPSNKDKYSYGQEAIVESLEVVLLESFPLQAQAIVSGNLRDGCTELYEISTAYQDQAFILMLTTRRSAWDVACTEALVPFEEVVSLDILSLEAGTYTVIAQDKKATFTLDVDNVFSPPVENTKYRFGSHVMVKSMRLTIMESFPVKVNVTISGDLPDGCTEIYEINVLREEEVFTIEIVTRKPKDVACTMALVPFEEVFSLDVEGLPAGEYTVQFGEISDTFVLEQDNEL